MGEYEDGLRLSPPDEWKQATSPQTFDEQTAQQQREALIKKQYGPKLTQIVKVADPDIDEKTQARAVDFFAKNIAERPSKSEPGQIRHEDLRRIAEQSIEQAYNFEQTQRDEQASAQPLNEQPRHQAMDGSHPRSPARDYGELQRTHEQVAAQQNADRSTTTESASAVLSKVQLQNMEERYADVRKTGNLKPTPSELGERKDLTQAQTEDREMIDRTHGPDLNGQHKQERALLDHQHLAERVGAEARWIGLVQKERGAPDAASYDQDARRAYHTARLVHEQRQHLGAGVDRAQDTDGVIQQHDRQKGADAREAVPGGKSLTSEQSVQDLGKAATDGAARIIQNIATPAETAIESLAGGSESLLGGGASTPAPQQESPLVSAPQTHADRVKAFREAEQQQRAVAREEIARKGDALSEHELGQQNNNHDRGGGISR